MVKEFTEITAKDAIANSEILVLDLWAPWCGPCRLLSPLVDKLSEKYSDKVEFGKVNVDDNTNITNEFNVRGIPTILFFKGGQLIDKLVGLGTEAIYEEKIETLINS